VTGSPRGGRLSPFVLVAAVSLLVAAACSTAPATSGPAVSAHPTGPDSTGAPVASAHPTGPDSTGAPVATAPATATAVVVEVVDGDTVEVAIGDRVESVRLIGIDSPEKTGGLRPAECFGDEATARARQLLPRGSDVGLVRDVEARDRYDRLLAYVFGPDGSFVNLDLVEDGYAAAFPFEPNTTFATEFAAAESAARRLGLGLWGACGSPDREL